MKADIHPPYYENLKITCACGNIIVAGSTRKELKTELCSACHPFYTGKQKLIDTAGRVDKFLEKIKKMQAMKEKKVKTLDAENVEQIFEKETVEFEEQKVETEMAPTPVESEKIVLKKPKKTAVKIKKVPASTKKSAVAKKAAAKPKKAAASSKKKAVGKKSAAGKKAIKKSV